MTTLKDLTKAREEVQNYIATHILHKTPKCLIDRKEIIRSCIKEYPLDADHLSFAINRTKENFAELYEKFSTMITGLSDTFSVLDKKDFVFSGNSIAKLLEINYLCPPEKRSFPSFSYNGPYDIPSFVTMKSASDIDVFVRRLPFGNPETLYNRITNHAADSLHLYDSIKDADKEYTDEYDTSGLKNSVLVGQKLITTNAVTFKNGFQIIYRNMSESFRDDFDLEHCKLLYDPHKNILSGSMIQMYCAIHMIAMQTDYASAKSRSRMRKYLDRGYLLI